MIERITQITIAPEGEPIYSDRAYVVQIEDDASGEFLSVSCHDEQCKGGEIRVDPAEWPALRSAIDRMAKECKE